MPTEWSELIVIASILQFVWTVGVASVAAWIAAKYFKLLTPTLKLAIKSRPIQGEDRAIVLELEIENISKAEVVKDKALLKVSREPSLKIDATKTAYCLAREFVDFSSGAEEVLTTTERIFPGEMIHVERIYAIEPGDILRVGFQFVARPSKIFPPGRRWTTTGFITCQISTVQ